MKRRRYVEAYSLSFLDCICCGFGAIILLLVLSKIYEPVIARGVIDNAILEKCEELGGTLAAGCEAGIY